MPRPRLRFREFLLIITMVSLIVASFAIRAKTAALLSAHGLTQVPRHTR